jgi:hypothetical protein
VVVEDVDADRVVTVFPVMRVVVERSRRREWEGHQMKYDEKKKG